jgi:hypothetical protein
VNRMFLARFCVLSFVVAAICHSQTPTSSISGVVTDPKDAVVAGAHIFASNEAEGFSRETATNASGLYVLPDLPVGAYNIRIEHPGFATSEFKNVVLQTGRAVTVDTKLQIASAGATVEVNATTSSVDLTQSMIQGQITSRTIESIPLNGRNFLELAYLVPGNRPAPTFDPTKNKYA